MTNSAGLLCADRPSTDPAQDLFGHAPFARTLAQAIQGHRWGGDDAAKTWWQDAAKTDAGLMKLVAANASEATSSALGDYAVRVRIRVNPKGIAHYADPLMLETRIRALLSAGSVPDQFAAAAKQFVLEVQQMKEGKDPDAIGFCDD